VIEIYRVDDDCYAVTTASGTKFLSGEAFDLFRDTIRIQIDATADPTDNGCN